MANVAVKLKTVTKPLKLDIGCGLRRYRGDDPAKPEDDWIGVDRIAFPGVDAVVDVTKPWPWPDNSVARIYASHIVEHLDALERIHFFNEAYRVLVADGTCKMVVPHWATCRAYGDPTHKFPPMGEFFFYYLSRKWRLGDGDKLEPQAPHTDKSNWHQGYDCDFDATWGNGLNGALNDKPDDFKIFAQAWCREAILEIHATLTAKK